MPVVMTRACAPADFRTPRPAIGPRVACALALALAVLPDPGLARDLGVVGQTFAIAEPDLIAYLKARLAAAEKRGEIAAFQRRFAETSRAHILRPTPVEGLAPTTEVRSWLFDPSLVVQADVRDTTGHVLARRGEVINPLQHLAYDRVLVFIDGDRPDQVALARRLANTEGATRTRIILTKGSPIALMRRQRLQVYFDQSGRLSGHFGLRHVPSVIRRDGDRLRISEVRP